MRLSTSSSESVYPKPIRALLTLVVPYGFASFYPAQAIFGNSRLEYLAKASPLVALGMFIGAYSFWKRRRSRTLASSALLPARNQSNEIEPEMPC